MELYLLSNSRMPGEEPFLWAMKHLLEEWRGRIQRAALIPFAGVGGWDDYADWVASAMAPSGIEVISVHRDSNALASCDAVFVGGGNTFHLTTHLYQSGQFERVQEAVRAGKIYMGWSAGANVAAPTLRTTNDMPIIEPPSFKTFGFVPFQINPHYSSVVPPGHRGETRDQRLNEFVVANPSEKVIGLPEGSMIISKDSKVSAWGEGPLRIFSHESPLGLDVDIADFRG